jgi:hypothetical protein
MRVLFITNYKGMAPFIQDLVIQLKKRNIYCDIIDTGEWKMYNNDSTISSSFKVDIKIRFIYKMFNIMNLFFLLCLSKEKYDSVNIFYFQNWLKLTYSLLVSKAPKINILYAGSDFYRISDKKKYRQKKFLEKCNKINFTAVGLKKDFNIFFNYQFCDKLTLASFGLPLLNTIFNKDNINTHLFLREKYKVRKENKIITIGYNASPAQQHLKILDEIRELCIEKNITIFIPLTYGGVNSYKKEIEQYLIKHNINYLIFESFLSKEELVEIRLISDITINFQTSDQASGSLLEYLCGKNVMIVADWLPYSFWDDVGIFYYKCNFKELKNTLSHVINTDYSDQLNRNQEIVCRNWSWDKTISDWINLLGNNNDNNS